MNGPVRESSGIDLIGHSNLGGIGDCMHVNLVGDVAYVGHMGQTRVGTSIVDVSDPTNPRLVGRLETPGGTHSHKVQVVDELLVVNYERNMIYEPNARYWRGGIALFDISRPTNPEPISVLEMPGKGVHRMTFWEWPYAYMSGSADGFTDRIFMVVDLSDPSRPKEVSRWWLPGMNSGKGEEPSWLPGQHYWLHHPIVMGGRAYCSWWDAGLVILDIRDPERPEMVSQLGFDERYAGCTHTALPIPGRDLLVVVDEAIRAPEDGVDRVVRLVDTTHESEPAVVGTLPKPAGDYPLRGGLFGPHNAHEMRPGSFVSSNLLFLTYFNAGIRAYDITDPAEPAEVAFCVPEAPVGQPAIQMNDLIVTKNGLIFATDRFNGGLYVFTSPLIKGGRPSTKSLDK